MPRDTVSITIRATREAAFDLIHDYRRRLEWDSMLSEARLLGAATEAGKGVRSLCVGKWRSGFIGLETEYVSFEPGAVAAIKMVNRPPLFSRFAATIRHEPLDDRSSRVTYHYNFRARPAWLAWLLEPVMNRMLRRETKLRLRALKRFLEADGPVVPASPFLSVLGHVRKLPGPFRDQYLTHDSTVVFRGVIRRAWNRPRLLRPFFALLSRWDVLFSEQGEGFPASLTIETGVRGQSWSRSFGLAEERYMNAVVLYDADRDRIVERFEGFGGTFAIEADWCLEFVPPNRMEVRTGSWAVRLGRLRIPLPRALCPQVTVVEEADLEEETIAVAFTMTHFLFGPVWGYEGDFSLS